MFRHPLILLNLLIMSTSIIIMEMEHLDGLNFQKDAGAIGSFLVAGSPLTSAGKSKTDCGREKEALLGSCLKPWTEMVTGGRVDKFFPANAVALKETCR